MTMDDRIDRLVDSINTLNGSVIELSATMKTLATKEDIMDLKQEVVNNRHSTNKTFTILLVVLSFVVGGSIPLIVI